MDTARRIVFGVLVAAGFALAAQQAETPSSANPNPNLGPAVAGSAADLGAVFAPFPSRLRAGVADGAITLTWVDSPDLSGSYAVYRSTSPISADQLDAATKVATVDHGVQSYTDKPSDSQAYYYAVLALQADGSPFRIVIPLRNATSVALSLPPPEPTPAPAPEPASSPAPAASPTAAPAAPVAVAPSIDDLTARAQGDAILLSYHAATPGSRIVVYRGAGPIEDAADLLDASLVSAFTDKDGSFADYPVPGIDYWYALLNEDDLKAGKVDLRLGHNATATPVRVATRPGSGSITAAPPGARSTPLPSILIQTAPDQGASPLPKGSAPPPERQLSPEAEKAVAALLADAPIIEPKMPAMRLLTEESGAPAGGEDYALSLIVNGKLAAGDWNGSVDELKKYLSLNRSAGVTARARFYLGEALAHAGAYRDAVFEFLSAQSQYSVETKPWIDYVLYCLRKG